MNRITRLYSPCVYNLCIRFLFKEIVCKRNGGKRSGFFLKFEKRDGFPQNLGKGGEYMLIHYESFENMFPEKFRCYICQKNASKCNFLIISLL